MSLAFLGETVATTPHRVRDGIGFGALALTSGGIGALVGNAISKRNGALYGALIGSAVGVGVGGSALLNMTFNKGSVS